MKTQLESFDRWLREPGPFKVPRVVTVLIVLIAIGALGLIVISKIP